MSFDIIHSDAVIKRLHRFDLALRALARVTGIEPVLTGSKPVVTTTTPHPNIRADALPD